MAVALGHLHRWGSTKLEVPQHDLQPPPLLTDLPLDKLDMYCF